MWSESRDHLCLPCKIWIKEIKTMKKIKHILFLMSLFAAAGLTYTVITLKDIPESFDWEEEDE